MEQRKDGLGKKERKQQERKGQGLTRRSLLAGMAVAGLAPMVLNRLDLSKAAQAGTSYSLTSDGGIDFSNTNILLHIDGSMKLKVSYQEGSSLKSISRPAVPTSIVVNGVQVSNFVVDTNLRPSAPTPIITQYGPGERVTLAANGVGPGGAPIGLRLTIDLYTRYPATVLFQSTFVNNSPHKLQVNSLWSSVLLLDRKLVNSKEPSHAFKMACKAPADGNGLEDRIWDIGSAGLIDPFSGSQDDANYARHDVANNGVIDYDGGQPAPNKTSQGIRAFNGPWGGGGVPIISVWGPEIGMAAAAVEPGPQVLRVPLSLQPGGQVKIGVQQINDLASFQAGASLAAVHTTVSVHSLDFFDAAAIFGSMLRDNKVGSLQCDTPDATPHYAPYWCSFGIEERLGQVCADPAAVNARLYIPADLGLDYMNIDSGWDNGTGSFCANPDLYAKYGKGDDGLRTWIDQLHRGTTGGTTRPLKVCLWIDPGWVDDGVRRQIVDDNAWTPDLNPDHIDPGIMNADGTYYEDDWGRQHLCPTVAVSREYVRRGILKVLTPNGQPTGLTDRNGKQILGWGADRLFVDGAFMAPPCHNTAHKHSSPHESELNDGAFNAIVFSAARSIDPNFPLEVCPCGAGHAASSWQLQYFSQTTCSDPDFLSFRPWEFRAKWDKAIAGPAAPINSDHIEGAGQGLNPDLNYMFPMALGLGLVYQTYWWRKSWQSSSIGQGVKVLYQAWFNLYKQLQLCSGEYLNLYDMAWDFSGRLGAHCIRKNSDLFYVFAPPYNDRTLTFSPFSGAVQLRGLQSGMAYKIYLYSSRDITIDPNNPSIPPQYVKHGDGPTIALNIFIPENTAYLYQVTPASGEEV